MADPAPVAQTFFVDQDVEKIYKLDGILTVVDAKHILAHLKEEKPDGLPQLTAFRHDGRREKQSIRGLLCQTGLEALSAPVPTLCWCPRLVVARPPSGSADLAGVGPRAWRTRALSSSHSRTGSS